jgi:hypothetical protein
VRAVRYTEPADACFDPLTPEQRRGIVQRVAQIQADPAPDYVLRIPFPELGADYYLYIDSMQYWVLYAFDDTVVTIRGLGVGGFYVPIDRDDC